jgi:hypothetical protein
VLGGSALWRRRESLPGKKRRGVKFHTVEGYDESHEALRDPGFNLADVCNQRSVVHNTVEDSLRRHCVGGKLWLGLLLY